VADLVAPGAGRSFAVILLAKDMAVRKSNDAEVARYRTWIDGIAERARQQTAAATTAATAGT